MPDPTELAVIALELEELVNRGLGPHSLFALESAMRASRVEGISGLFVVTIPLRRRQWCDVTFASGQVELQTINWGRAAS